MVTAPVPSKVTRVWDKDFNVVHVFSDGEDYERGLPLDHPVARHLRDASDRRGPVFLTVDENGHRTSGRLESFDIFKQDDDILIQAHWDDF